MRKLILVLALVSAMGFGFGRLNEDLCALGGSFADDPSTPIRVVELALPGHTQGMQKLVVSIGGGVQLPAPVHFQMAPAYVTVETRSAPPPFHPSPIRC